MTTLRVWIAALALLAAMTVAANAADDGAWIEKQRAQWQVPGVAVAVVEDGRPPQFFAAGLCNLEQRRPCSERSQFPIASNTKFFTGLLAAVLAEQQALQLDAPLIKAWPELRLSDARAESLTLLDLLSQRSGIGSVDWPYFWDAKLDRDDYLVRLQHVPMVAPPRERWHYANANYVVAGAYMERVTRRDWQTLIRQHLLAPLQMREAGFGQPTDDTRGYTAAGERGAVMPAPAGSPEALAPAGALVLSARDYARLLSAVVAPASENGAAALPPRAVEIATTPWIANDHDPRVLDGPGGYALGLFTAHYGGDALRYHIGRTTGYTSAVAMLPQRGLAVAVLTNVDNTNFPPALALALLDRRRGRTGDDGMQAWWQIEHDRRPPRAIAAVAGGQHDYAGRYAHPAWGCIEIFVAGQQLRIRMAGLDTPLQARGDNRYGFAPAPGWNPLQLVFGDDHFMLDDGASLQPMRFDRTKDRTGRDTAGSMD